MIRATLAVVAESSIVVALCVLAAALVSSIATINDPIWWMLALFLGVFWGAIVASLTGGALFGLLCLLRRLPHAIWFMVVSAAMLSGLGVLAFNALVLQHPLNGIDISLICLTAVVAGFLVSRRMRSGAATKGA